MQDQTIFEDGRGNCLAACVASVLGLPISDVPNFAELDYFEGLRKWLSERGLFSVEIRFSKADHCASAYFGYQDCLAVMWGDSPRHDASGKRKQHAVVGQTNGYGMKVVHDPHPSREGLHGPPLGVMWIVKGAS
jgi:hypothetical protein